MTKRHFAVLCPEASGHTLPMSALTTELSSRGHGITYITTVDGVDRCRASGVDARQVGAEQFPRGVSQRHFAELGNLTGVAAAKYVLRLYERGVQMMLDEAPGQIRDCGADVILSDETWWVARTLGQQLELPYLSVCNALPFHPDVLHPSMFSTAGYGTGWAAPSDTTRPLPTRLDCTITTAAAAASLSAASSAEISAARASARAA